MVTGGLSGAVHSKQTEVWASQELVTAGLTACDLACVLNPPPRLVLQGHNGYSSYAGNAALENGLAYNNALANGVHSTPLGTLPLFGQGAASSPLLAA